LSCGLLVPDEAVRFRQDQGRKWCDWAGTSYFLDLVSERLLGVLADRGATGWSTYAVSVLARDGSDVAGYRGFAVTAKADPAWELSQPTIQSPKVQHGPAYKAWRGLCFEPSTWDGSDVFRVAGQLVCTERVYTALRDAELSNVGYERVTEWMRDWKVD
jgi:hypothetical protein